MKFKSTFATSRITKIVGQDLDKYISIAGLDKLKPLMPAGVSLDGNPDLVGIVFNAATPGLANLNGDCIDKPTAIKIAKNFIWKYINIEHSSWSIVGVICNAGFSRMGTNEIISEEEVLKSTEPVNLCVAALVYRRAVSDEYIERLEECCDEMSPNFGKVSGSWEISFEDYDICVGERDCSKAKCISDSETKANYEKYLISNYGSGKKDGEHVYRLIKGETVLPLGIGLVGVPAAAVSGVQVVENEEEETELHEKKEELLEDNASLTNKNLETSNENTVITNIEQEKTMNKINTIADLTDENLKKISNASVITEFIDQELRKASEKFVQDEAKAKTAVSDLEKKNQELAASITESATKLKETEDKLNKLTETIAQKEAEEKFNTRLEGLDTEFDLSDEKRQTIASDIKGLDDESFTKYITKMTPFLTKKVAVASVTPPAAPVTPPAPETSLSTALTNSTPANPEVPNAPKGEDDKFANLVAAFDPKKNIKIVR